MFDKLQNIFKKKKYSYPKCLICGKEIRYLRGAIYNDKNWLFKYIKEGEIAHFDCYVERIAKGRSKK